MEIEESLCFLSQINTFVIFTLIAYHSKEIIAKEYIQGWWALVAEISDKFQLLKPPPLNVFKFFDLSL